MFRQVQILSVVRLTTAVIAMHVPGPNQLSNPEKYILEEIDEITTERCQQICTARSQNQLSMDLFIYKVSSE